MFLNQRKINAMGVNCTPRVCRNINLVSKSFKNRKGRTVKEEVVSKKIATSKLTFSEIKKSLFF
jgi:hypothetical protein